MPAFVDHFIPKGRLKRLWTALGVGLAIWLALAYVALPYAWRHYEHERGLSQREMVTRTKQGIAGDAINFGLVGSQADVFCAFRAAGWSPANAVTFASSVKIVGSVLFKKPDPAAPVSPLFYDGRVEDLAFELPQGASADQRHHIRLWQVLDSGQAQRPVWLASASFDRGVGFSHYTLQVTHHIAADIDAERDLVGKSLASAGAVENFFQISGVGPTLFGRNGGGDRYFTDGEILMASLVEACRLHPGVAPKTLDNPPLVDLNDALWRNLRPFMRQ